MNKLPAFDPRAIASAYLAVLGLPQSWLRTEAEMASFRKRSDSARKGWATRRQKEARDE